MRKYYLWNKAEDFACGQMENLCWQDGRLRMCRAESGQAGYFLSRRIDSGEDKMTWNRLRVNAQMGANMAVVVYLYATDSPVERDRFAASSFPEEQFYILEKRAQKQFRNPGDVLLHGLEGRYMWVGAVFWGEGGEGPELLSMQAFFPRETWNRYLPEIYQTEQSEFLGRFLAVFQTVYEEMEADVRDSARSLDVQTAKPDMVDWMARWLEMKNTSLWEKKRLRKYLLPGGSTLRMRGTMAELERMVEQFCGERPFLKEMEGEHGERWIRIMVSEEAVPDQHTRQALKKMAADWIPEGRNKEVIVLRPRLLLDHHSYLGVNSILSGYAQSRLDEACILGETLLG